jgi:DNA-directed RNA polymerase specialized sigma24 family protein
MMMPKSKLREGSTRFEQLADELDPEKARVERTDDLREIAAAASEAVRADEARLREAVELARERGRSWNEIGVALGVSRQAARQRFSGKVNT